MALSVSADFLIIGGGIIGVCLSLELKKRYPDCQIALLEKEEQPGQHASGRNSGVLHAGFYYTAESLKARLTRDGNRELTAYCLDHNLPINQCGKLVVARNENDRGNLPELMQRGHINGVKVELITATEAKEIEPRVKTCEQALYSPSTATINPNNVMQSLVNDAQAIGVQLLTGTKYLGNNNGIIKTTQGNMTAGYVINAAGLYADKIARQYGFGEDYSILPFKGLYLEASPDESLKCNIYPVPGINNPFLGVHFTVTADGRVTIGPTAVPAFWREQYQGLTNFSLDELIQIISMEVKLFSANNFGFRQLAYEELKKHSKSRLLSFAGELVTGIKEGSFKTWGRPGIRAQLVNLKTKKLEMDFCYEGDDKSFHVLNAVSPAFTCSFPFSRLIADEIGRAVA